MNKIFDPKTLTPSEVGLPDDADGYSLIYTSAPHSHQHPLHVMKPWSRLKTDCLEKMVVNLPGYIIAYKLRADARTQTSIMEHAGMFWAGKHDAEIIKIVKVTGCVSVQVLPDDQRK